MILEEYKLKKKGQCHIHSEVYIVQLFRSGGGGGVGIKPVVKNREENLYLLTDAVWKSNEIYFNTS